MGELVPAYPQPYRLFNPLSGHPLFSGPNGQPGYGDPQPNADEWTMPDGTRVWFYDTSTPDATNRVALGLDVIWPGAPSIGYAGLYDALVRHGASEAPGSAPNPVCPGGGGGRTPPGTSEADLFAAVGMAESGGHWGDHNNNAATGDDSIGLLQINLRAHPQWRAQNLYNIDTNMAAAFDVSDGWRNPCPWSTYKSGAYLQYLRGGHAPVGGVTGPPPPPPVRALGHGPIESSVDAAVDFLFGSIPLVGGDLKSAIKRVLHPIAKVADDVIATVDRAWHVAVDEVKVALHLAEQVAADGIREAEHLADQGLRALVSFTEGLIRDAERLASLAVTEAEHLASVGLRDLASFTEGLIRDAEHLADVAVRDAEHLASVGLHDLASFTEGLIRDAEHLADAAVREAEHLAAVGLHDLESLARTLVRDAEGLADAAVREAERLGADALHALEHDVIEPLEGDARHWFGDVLGPIEPLLHALHQLGEWVIAAAKVAIAGPFDVADTVHAITHHDVADHVRATDYHGLLGVRRAAS